MLCEVYHELLLSKTVLIYIIIFLTPELTKNFRLYNNFYKINTLTNELA